MRFDYYAATIQDDPEKVLAKLAKLGHAHDRCDRLAATYHYQTGISVHNRHSGLACRVFFDRGKSPYAFASSDATEAFSGLLRAEWPDRHLVTRFDPCQDFYDVAARRKVSKFIRSFAKARDIRLRQIVNPIHPTAGNTTYLGGDKSPFRLRAYDKGWEQFAKVHAELGRKRIEVDAKEITFKTPEGVEVHPDQWIRVELVARPQDAEARRVAASCTPEEAWGLTAWTHEFAHRLFSLDLERVFFRGRKISTDDKALQWMLTQYAGPLGRLAESLEGWDNAGLELGRRLQIAEEERRKFYGR